MRTQRELEFAVSEEGVRRHLEELRAAEERVRTDRRLQLLHELRRAGWPLGQALEEVERRFAQEDVGAAAG